MKISIHGTLLGLAVIAAFSVGCSNDSGTPASQEKPPFEGPLFSMLPASETGVDFTNQIKESETLNVYEYVNSYNGGGVSLGDINNDGLTDIFLTGNMVDNKLYLNKGNLQFEDITAKAGVAAPNSWCSGATMVDINADGYLDIYVCRAWSDDDDKNRENLLYINKGDNTFSEEGAAYGVNDNGYASQATFLDYDLDGDLDLFVGNFPREFLRETHLRIAQRNNPKIENSDKFYRNEGNGKFTDVTVEAGILDYGWSLGVMSSDLNNDGWPDIYVAVDHDEPDYYFLNQGNGTFVNNIYIGLRHMSSFSMGVDLSDFNNDGYLDILALDMAAEDNFRQKTQMSGMAPEKFWTLVNAGFHYQYMRNMLQLNNGNGTFSELGQMAGIHKTDWSWSALMIDFDNDGWKDIYVTNGYKQDVRDNDYLISVGKKLEEREKKGMPAMSTYEIIAMSKTSPKLKNYYFKNNGDLTFTKNSKEAGLDAFSFSNGAAYGDLDNDGDLDLVVNNLTDPAYIYKNNSDLANGYHHLRVKLAGTGKNVNGIGAKVTIKNGDQQQYQEFTFTRGFQSSVEEFLHFGLGEWDKVDELKVRWPDGKEQVVKNPQIDQVITLNQKDATPKPAPSQNMANVIFTDVSGSVGASFQHKENEYDDYAKEILLPHKMSQFGPFLATGDVNGDQLEDFFVGGATGQPGAIFIQQPDQGGFVEATPSAITKDKKYEDMGALLFDADGDGDNDLYVVSGGNSAPINSPNYQDRLYTNDGKGNFTRDYAALPKMVASGSCVVPSDFDGDGDQDLFVGGRVKPGTYPFPAQSYLLKNEGGKFTDITKDMAPDLMEPGLVTHAIWTDFNKDAKLDLIVTGEWMPLSFYENDGNGKLVNKTDAYGMTNTTGWWNHIVGEDFDNDGDMDYIAGNLGTNYKYEAKEDASFHIYCHDFDSTGTLDIVLGYFNGGDYFPVRGRQCSSEQMPNIKKKFPTYKEFGAATLEDVYGKQLNTALHYEAKWFASSYIENKGDGTFEVKALPNMAQLSCINDILVRDFDGDGNKDLLVAGNLWVSEVETGRADAGNGLFMKGDGTGQFKPVPITESGFFAPMDAKDLALVKLVTGEHIVLVANNNAALQTIHWKTPASEKLVMR